MAQHHKKRPRNAHISALSHEGRGIAQIEGKTTFVTGALPGENVQFTMDQSLSRYDEGHAIAIKNPSPQRVTPRCNYYGVCGGCSLQHLSPKAQLALKQDTLVELLLHQANVIPQQLLKPLTGPQWYYRRRARLGIKYVAKKQKVLVGFRERDSRYLTDMNYCDVLHPAISSKLGAFADRLSQLTIRDKCPQLEVCVTDHVTAVILRHLSPIPVEDMLALQAFCKKHHWRLYCQPKGPDSIHCVFPDTQNLDLAYPLPAFDLTLQFQPHQFIQINHSINQQMITQALQLLDLKPQDRVLDLFCGIGNFSLPIAQQCQGVTGIEGDTLAVQYAKLNSKNNQLANCQFHCCNLFETPYNYPWAKQRYDKLLLDPPRAGAKEIVDYLAVWQPKRIVYVSCNPATLARDTKLFVQSGYRLAAAGIMDMFPHTKHVEAMALLTK